MPIKHRRPATTFALSSINLTCIFLTHIQAFTFHSALAILANTNSTAQVVVPKPAQICAPQYRSPMELTIAPPMGLPVSAASETQVNAIPKRVPTIFMSFVMLATACGISDWKAAQEKPYLC